MNTVEEVHHELERLLDVGESQTARLVAREALDRWPNNLKLGHLYSDALLRNGDVAAAIEHLQAMLEDRPERIWTAIRLVRAYLRSGRANEAAEVYVGRVWRGDGAEARYRENLLNEVFYRLPAERRKDFLERLAGIEGHPLVDFRLASVLAQQGASADALAVLERSRPDRDSCEAALLRADMLFVEDRCAEALALLDEWHARVPSDPRVQMRRADLLLATGRAGKALPVLEQLGRDQPNDGVVHRKLLACLHVLGEYARLPALLDQALRRWPGDWMFIFQANRLPIGRDAFDGLLQLMKHNAAAGCLDDWCRFVFAGSCLRAGETRAAIDELLRLTASPLLGARVAPILAALKCRPVEDWTANPRFDDLGDRDVQIVRVDGATATVLVFASWDGLVSYLPLGHIDRLLPPDIPANVVYLRDFRAQAYLKGIAGLGVDEAQTIERLRALLQGLGAPRLVTLGASGSGFAAVRYGALLGADLAVSFAGPTSFRRLARESRPSLSNPWFVLNRLWESDTSLPKDLAPIVRDHPSTRVWQVFGSDCATDAGSAQLIAGFPNVTLKAIPGVADHWVLLHLIAQQGFEDLLTDALTGP